MKNKTLFKHRRPRPLTFVVMDGIGYRANPEGNAVSQGYTPHLDWLLANCHYTLLKAHGTAVGLPSDSDMGNSEVGHNAIGAGRFFPQGARLVNEAIASGSIFEGKGWRRLIDFCRKHDGSMHFIGLFSDGNVHSHLDHLKAMLKHLALHDKVLRARIHILLDGRDVGETSALDYVIPFESFLKEINRQAGVDYRIASGGGRMKVTMDRYEADWNIVALGWKTHVAAEGRTFGSAQEAIETYRKEKPGIIDQDLPPFVVADGSGPVGPVKDGDSVVFFNYRGDRAIEISRAFEEPDFDKFPRIPYPNAAYAGMMEYDTEAHIPKNYLVEPPVIGNTMGEFLCKAGMRQMAISETQKFGHVTYFWNGNRSGLLDPNLEEYVEVPSDRVPFEERPWMKAAEITDRVVEAIGSGKFDMIRLNYANGDMVGHTGVFQAARIAVETVDLCLGRLMKATQKAGGIMVVTADHGNAEEMYELDKKTGKPKYNEEGKPKAKTAHTLNPVWFIVYDPSGECASLRFNPEIKEPKLTNIAATCFQLLDLEPPELYDPPLLMANG
ncbi:2,3-bisphosphoglycerate-independent phosphoglycerate mutase [Desulforhabdus amnigena]|uniref:2,3-bisphosphoglycerate-independent phosphoglycerate mutase n=1 Tax=Desulforhabdus amnigena TaxID=40218 RepID=A0A9W6L8R1_9BACT|nr:2,3-bisphosphoglycerate-independent phosphoglycerate mutase [Desulforhabdus amnigena]NLJ27385.1 2,3-bisphosphoglycerate-independent phosphoglycerate mutase [Deltaproteobacteria bacterium]GLI35937.1 putative 2,3-bisphosphoglycerate-independent phosphoglycerate mutase [Desulforhabdus amnigena]